LGVIMIKKSSFIILLVGLVVLILTLASCMREDARYSKYLEKYNQAVKEYDGEKVIKLIEEINDSEFLKRGGEKYLRLEVSGFAVIGEYEKAINAIDKYGQKHKKNYDLSIAKIVLYKRIGYKKSDLIRSVFDELYRATPEKMNEKNKVYFLYLSMLLGESKTPYMENNVYPLLSKESQEAVEYLRAMSEEELFESPPIGIITNQLIFNEKNANQVWWEE
jgi:hypothetical protein